MATAESSGNPLPPSYTDDVNRIVSDLEDDLGAAGLDLPAYSQSQQSENASRRFVQSETKEFDYAIEKGGETFLMMTLIGRRSQNVPTFFEGSPVTGKIKLYLKKPDPIDSVILTVKGSLVTGGTNYLGYTLVFLDQKKTVWSQEEQLNTLDGDYTWPFSIDLPEEVEMAAGFPSQLKMFRLPQTFNQRYTHATIKYEISVKIVRKGFLRSNEELSAPFGYIPNVRPPPLPPLRRLAYEEGTPLLGPKVDPDGWYLQNSIQIKGTSFNDRAARVECRLFLAKPLSYTRGLVIPLFVTLESDDEQVLDLLSSPKLISVRVRRRIRYTSEPHKAIESKVWRDEVDHSQRAVWWRATEYAGEDPPAGLRMLNGELHLKPDMVPTSAMGNYSVNYSVVLLPFDTPGFKVDDCPLLFEQPITIVTAFAPGPRPRMSTPADYTPDIKRKADELQTKEFSFGFY